MNYIHEPGISVVKEALLANEFTVHAMHDPTEGGLANGAVEMARASGNGLRLFNENIHIFEESEILCKEYSLDLLGTITSGSLLLAADKENMHKILEAYKSNGINAAVIGVMLQPEYGYRITKKDGTHQLEYSEKDEITKLF